MPLSVPINHKQISIPGPGGFFRPKPLSTPGNQITVEAGYVYSGGRTVSNKFTTGDQLTSPGSHWVPYWTRYRDAIGFHIV